MKIYVIIGLIITIIISNIVFVNQYNIENLENHGMNIVCYIHVCQMEGWKRSYDMLINSIKESKLYDTISEIRIGVVSENGDIIKDERLNDPKIKIVYTGKNNEYERPTLLHMKKESKTDPENTLYLYLHTKGIRHFGTKNENIVVNWINDMLDCNVLKWQEVIQKLKDHETYGCNYNNVHYSGNFWWATKKHIQKLSDHIPDYYTAPEDYVLTNKDNMYCARNCYDSYKPLYSNEMY